MERSTKDTSELREGSTQGPPGKPVAASDESSRRYQGPHEEQQTWHADLCSSMFIPVYFMTKRWSPSWFWMWRGVPVGPLPLCLEHGGAGLLGKPLGAQAGTTKFDINLGKTTREELQK